LGDGRFRLTVRKENEPDFTTDDYVVLRVIPEHLIVVFQPVVEGGVSPGFHVIMLNEHDGKTVVTVTMEHAALATGQSEEEARNYWHSGAKDSISRWRDTFIPTLKKLVQQGA
jgi:hypothetical protein